MKKTLLMLVAFMATMTAFADNEGWSTKFTPVADKADLDGVHTAVAGDGSVYVSSTYKQAFTFADKTVVDPEGLLSSCIVKFDKDGNQKWSVALLGACKVYAMAADADGTLYVAGKSEDVKVICIGVDEKRYEIENPASDPWGTGELSVTANSAFVLKISSTGAIEAYKTFTPEVNAAIHAIEGDPYEMGMMMNIYDSSYNDPMYVTPISMKIDGDKVYVAATYTGDVPALGWKGAYLNYFDMMIFDMRSMGVFSLTKSDLNSSENVAYVQVTGTVAEGFSQQYPEALNFAVNNGKPCVFFIGFGNLTITTPAGSSNFTFATAEDESGNKEHPFVMVDATNPNNQKIFS